MKKCMISRYDEKITEPPFLTIQVGTMEVNKPEKDHLGEQFYEVLQTACRKNGFKFKFYTTSTIQGYDYNVIVY